MIPDPKSVKIEIIVMLLLIGFMYLVSPTDRADATDNSINQNASIDMENQGGLVPWYGFQGRSSPGDGVFVTGITPGSPAADAGIIEGDVIIKVDNESVNNWVQMKQILMNATVGQISNFTLLRSSLGGMQEADVRLIVGGTFPPKYEEASIYSEPDNVNLSSYEDTFLSQYITIDYPASWNITAEDGEYTFKALLEESNDPFKEYLRLAIHPSQQGTIDELISVKTPLRNLNVTKPHNLTISDNPARELEYTYSDDTYGEIKAMKVATQVENTTFLFSYGAQASKFNTYWPTIERMINTFKTLELLDHENFDIGMRVKYPSDWNKTEEPYYRTLYSEAHPSIKFSPRAQNDSTQPSNELRIYSYLSNGSLDEEVNQAINDYTQPYGRPEFELREKPMDVSTSTLPFKMLNYSYDNISGNKTNAVELMTKSNDKIYSLIYSADEDDFPEYLPFVNITTKSLEPFELLDHENFDIGMRVKYPSDWNKTEEPYSRTLFSENVSSVLFYPLAQGDSVQPSTELRISSYLTDKSLDDEVKQTISDYKGDFIGHQDFDLISINPINLTNLLGPSSMLNYSYKEPFSDKNINATEIITNLTNKVYSIRYSAETDEFSKSSSTLNGLINTFKNFGVSRYEIPVANQSGIILRYPSEYPWDLNETDDKNVNFMRENPYDPSLWQHFFLSVYPYNKNLTGLENELGEFYDKYRFQILNENKTDTYRTTLDGNVTVHRVEFSYYDKNTNEDVNGVQVFTVYNNYAFIITYVTEPSRYNDYLPTVEEVIDSVKIITPVKNVRENLVARHLPGGLISDIEYPRSWNYKSFGGVRFEILSPIENGITDHFNESLLMVAGAAGTTNLGDSVGEYVNSIKQQNLTNFVLGDSLQINFSKQYCS
jgi:hypothetical protein